MEDKQELLELSERLGELCRRHGVTVTTAESCTGGGLASAITEVPGSSDYFETGYVTYANSAKARLLGVPEMTLESLGSVSRETVEAMVVGACSESGAGLGVAISGVAGPDGGSVSKPVGTVWLAWGSRDEQKSLCCRFDGDRSQVRGKAVHKALESLVHWLEELPVTE